MSIASKSEVSLGGRWGVAVFLVCTAALYSYLHFDKTLTAARQTIAGNQKLIARIGAIEGTTLVKVRWIDDFCFAQYFIYVRGQNWRFVELEVLACGSKEKPEFRIKER
jgi:hypothetical protein